MLKVLPTFYPLSFIYCPDEEEVSYVQVVALLVLWSELAGQFGSSGSKRSGNFSIGVFFFQLDFLSLFSMWKVVALELNISVGVLICKLDFLTLFFYVRIFYFGFQWIFTSCNVSQNHRSLAIVEEIKLGSCQKTFSL